VLRGGYRAGLCARSPPFTPAVKGQVEALVLLGLPLNGIDGISERCQDIVKNDHEISYCLIEDSSGNILYHSQEYPNTAEVEYVGNLSSEVSILESKTMGKIYDHASLLYDYDDKVVGRARIGFQDQILSQLVMDHLGSTILVLIAAFVAAFAVIVVFTRYDLVLPIRRLCGMAEDLAAGRFDTRAPQLNTRELDMLGNTMTGLAKSLQERDEEWGRNYHELESTNLELKTSYEHLTNISSELGRSREMYRSLLDDASDAILVCDENDDVVIANKAAEAFFGLPKARMEKTNYFSFLESITYHNLGEQFAKHHLAQQQMSIESNLRF